MSELWYDDHRKDAESFSVELILYNYGEDLQVLRERIAVLEAENQRLRDGTLEWFAGRAGDIIPNRYYQGLYGELRDLLQEDKPQ
jgi:hypothetical protein